MRKFNNANLVQGNILNKLLRMTFPMMLGMLGMIIFNLVDAYYIGKLGPNQLAAITFTFPVVLVINSLSAGIALGSSVLFSQFVGESDKKSSEELICSSFILGIIVNTILMTIGIFTIELIFKLLGARGIILEYIYNYMIVWYSGLIVIVIPQIGNNLIRALGDTKTPGIIMAIAAITNVILDPIFIFGFGPIPSFSIQGAAIATVISRSITLIPAIYILKYRENLIKFIRLPFNTIYTYWKKILFIGVPNALIQMSLPFGIGIVTKILSSYGTNVIAGFGIANKIELFALVFINSLAVVIGPFVGQNYGAKKYDRIKTALKLSEKISLFISVAIMIILYFLSKSIAGIFSDNKDVINTTIQYLSIVPLTYGFYGIIKISATTLNVLNKPIKSSLLILIQTFIFYIPLAIIGSKLFGITGVFLSLSLSYIFSSIISHFLVKKEIDRLFKEIKLM